MNPLQQRLLNIINNLKGIHTLLEYPLLLSTTERIGYYKKLLRIDQLVKEFKHKG